MPPLDFIVIVQTLDQFALEVAVEKDVPGLIGAHLLALKNAVEGLNQVEGDFCEGAGPRKDFAVNHKGSLRWAKEGHFLETS